jgi:hypothetical protein
MPGLDYPFVYECSNCDSETTITRSEARDLHPNPDSLNAHALVLRNRGWMRNELEGLLWCPGCIPSGTDEDQGDQEDTGQRDAFSGR